MTPAIRALIGIHILRLRRPAIACGVATAVLAMLLFMRGRLSSETAMGLLAGGGVSFIAIAPLSIVREKLDGSLRYFASLPVPGTDHAIARLFISALTCVPCVVGVGFALATKTAMSPIAAVAAAIASLILLTTISLVLQAVQIGVSVGRAMGYFMYCGAGFLVLMQVVGFAVKRGWLTWLRPQLLTPAGLMVASATVWLAFLTIGWFAFRSVARAMVTYRGEPLEP